MPDSPPVGAKHEGYKSPSPLPVLSLTPSRLGCLCLCAHRHLLRYELGYRPPHGIAEDYGTLNHCLLKLLHRAWHRSAHDLQTDDQVYTWLRPHACENARLRFARGTVRETLIESACQDVVRYVQAERRNLPFVIASEAPFRYLFVQTGLLLEGRIDVVLKHPGYGCTLRDFKSRQIGQDIGVVTHDTLAVSAYAYEAQHGVRVERIEIYNLKTGQIESYAFDDLRRSQATAILGQAADTLRGQKRDRRPVDDTACHRCDERALCRTVQSAMESEPALIPIS